MPPPPLRPHQTAPGAAILRSILRNQGHTFTVEMARQGGKNELSAQLEVLLLSLHAAKGGNAVKCSPTFKPQTITSMMRLRERLNDAGFNGLWHPEHGYIIRIGAARQLFFSADKAANVVGATAHIALEVDEAQDVAREKYQKEFRPMGASTNVTTILYGTAWDDTNLLEQTKQQNLDLQAKDGLQRHFEYPWEAIAPYNPAYARFVQAERDRLGSTHPLFLTQYCLTPLHSGAGMFSATQLAQLQGRHQRQTEPSPTAVYIAGIDLAGESEAPEDLDFRILTPHQDATVITIARLDVNKVTRTNPRPAIHIVQHHRWTGTPHPALYQRILAILKAWHCRTVSVDATGVGLGVASFLVDALGDTIVKPFTFSLQTKSRLGFQLLEYANAGNLQMYQPDNSPEHATFWHEFNRAKSEYRPNRTMSWSVDAAQGHDDFLISAALLTEAANRYQPRRAKGRITTLPPPDTTHVTVPHPL